MRMNYEHRSSIRHGGVPTSLKIIGVLAIMLTIIYTFAPKFFPNFMTIIAIPFWGVEENIRKDHIIISTELRDAMVNELLKENHELKATMHRNSSSTVPSLAFIVKKPPFTVFDSYIINIGDIGAKVGDKVYVSGNVLVGEIVEKNGSYAKVKLYSSYGEKFDVLIGNNNIQASALGRGGGSFEAVLPKDVKIQVGDTVLIPDLTPSVFGIVKDVAIDSGRAFSTILFTQPVNIYEQKWVQIYNK